MVLGIKPVASGRNVLCSSGLSSLPSPGHAFLSGLLIPGRALENTLTGCVCVSVRCGLAGRVQGPDKDHEQQRTVALPHRSVPVLGCLVSQDNNLLDGAAVSPCDVLCVFPEWHRLATGPPVGTGAHSLPEACAISPEYLLRGAHDRGFQSHL